MEAMTTDEEARNSRRAYEALFREESARMWRTVYAFTGGRGDIAEEAVAEAFARAIASQRPLPDPHRGL
jgi:DNA-directed RNA polymerase specialized sigma24 family protein